VLPDLYLIWQAQRQLVADIFALYGAAPSCRAPTCCIACSATLQATCCAMSRCARGSDSSCDKLSSRGLASAAGRVGSAVSRRLLGRAASRWIPIAGAAAVSAYAYWDTLQVARTARRLLESPANTGERDARHPDWRPDTSCAAATKLHSNPAAIALAFGLAHAPSVRPRYNVAPMQEVPIVRVSASGAREFVAVRWGLVPRWAKDPAIGSKMINARGETVATKPSFRTAFRRHRCLIRQTASTSGCRRPTGASSRS